MHCMTQKAVFDLAQRTDTLQAQISHSSSAALQYSPELRKHGTGDLHQEHKPVAAVLQHTGAPSSPWWHTS